MKTNLRVNHTAYPDGSILYPYVVSKVKNTLPIVAVLIIMLTYVVIIGSLLLIKILSN
jgi:hypothetical protein